MILGSGNKLGKKPKASLFTGPGRSLHQSTSDAEKNTDGKSPHPAVSSPILSKSTASQSSDSAPKASSGRHGATRTNAEYASEIAAPILETASGIRIHKFISPVPKDSKQIPPSKAVVTGVPMTGLQKSAKPANQAATATSTPLKREEINDTSAQVTAPDRVLPVLPQGWRVWPHGDTLFYQNLVNRETQWEFPTEPASLNPVAPTRDSGVTMLRPVYASPVPVGGIHQAGAQKLSAIHEENGKAQPMNAMTHLDSTTRPSKQLPNHGKHTFKPVTAQPLYLDTVRTLRERGNAIARQDQVSKPIPESLSFIDTSKREIPINPLLHGHRIYFIRPCSPGCLQSIHPLNINFPHSHPLEEGHFIKGETWWLNTPKQVTIHQHPLSELEVAELSHLEITGYIEALEICSASRLVLQDDNDLGWLGRGWITDAGILAFELRRRHSLMNLRDELLRRVGRGTP